MIESEKQKTFDSLSKLKSLSISMRFRDSFFVVWSEELFVLTSPPIGRRTAYDMIVTLTVTFQDAPHVTRPRLIFFPTQSLSTMNAATSNLAISLLVMQGETAGALPASIPFDDFFSLVARKIPFEDPEVLLYARIGYVSAQLIVLAVYFVCSSKVGT